MKKILLSLLAAVGLSTTGCSAQVDKSASSAKTAPSDGIVILAPQAFIDQAKADTTSFLLDVRTSKNTQKDIWLVPDNWITSIPRHSMPASSSWINPAPTTSITEAESGAMVHA